MVRFACDILFLLFCGVSVIAGLTASRVAASDAERYLALAVVAVATGAVVKGCGDGGGN